MSDELKEIKRKVVKLKERIVELEARMAKLEKSLKDAADLKFTITYPLIKYV